MDAGTKAKWLYMYTQCVMCRAVRRVQLAACEYAAAYVHMGSSGCTRLECVFVRMSRNKENVLSYGLASK